MFEIGTVWRAKRTVELTFVNPHASESANLINLPVGALVLFINGDTIIDDATNTTDVLFYVLYNNMICYNGYTFYYDFDVKYNRSICYAVAKTKEYFSTNFEPLTIDP
jgi:hypothetical protein